MSKYLSILLLSAAVVAVAQQPAPKPKIKDVPIQQTSPVSGSQMYTTYCAVCHGPDGKGAGPASSALKYPPTDLTTLSQSNGGKFPSDHVGAVLRFGVENPAHGTPDMPMWGDLMGQLDPSSKNSAPIVTQRISNLINYLKTIQN
jgi:mono/diheme cytochrome c family protein